MLDRQRTRRRGVIAGTHPEVLWLVEHGPVITTGRRAVPGLPSAQHLAAMGIALHHTERGGLATYHGPGQLTAYAIVDAWGRGMGAKGAVCAMEQGVIDWLATMNVDGRRRRGFPGVWVGPDKICAIGMHFSSGVSMHGIAINLTNGAEGFALITPCGITDGGITSLARLIGNAPAPDHAAEHLAPHLVHNLLNPNTTMSKGSLSLG